MNKAFWIIVAIDAALFLFLFTATLFQSGPSDGGREMAIGFGVIFPGIVIGLAVLLYVFSGAPLWRTIALIVAAGPGLLLAGIQVRNRYLNYLIAQSASGRGYFQGQALKNTYAKGTKKDC